MSVGHVSPEAAAGGPLALVEDGDTVTIDLERRRIDLEISDEEMASRRRGLKPHTPDVTSRWLRRYASLVTSASTGAVLRNV